MAKQKAVKKEEKENTNVVTPIGIISYPYLAKPDTGRAESSNKYSIELFVPKAVFVKESKALVETILKVARDFFKDPKLNIGDFKSPITDMSKEKKAEEWQKGMIRIRAKAASLATPGSQKDQKPMVIGPRKDPSTDKFPVWTDEQVTAIKGGDEGRFGGSVYAYPQQGGGVAIGLNFVQFAKEGKALGQGKMKQLENLGEIEVEVDSPDEIVDKEEDGDTEVDPMTQFA